MGGWGCGSAHDVAGEGLADLLVVDGGLGLPCHLARDRHRLVDVEHHDLEGGLREHRAQLRRVHVGGVPRVEVRVQVLDELDLHACASAHR